MINLIANDNNVRIVQIIGSLVYKKIVVKTTKNCKMELQNTISAPERCIGEIGINARNIFRTGNCYWRSHIYLVVMCMEVCIVHCMYVCVNGSWNVQLGRWWASVVLVGL